MVDQPIIKSFLDNDFYKFTMQNAVIKLYPRSEVRYVFVNRGQHDFPEGFAEMLKEEVVKMADLQLTSEGRNYLADNCEYLDPTYLDFLSGFRYDPSEVLITQKGGELKLEVEGYWYRTILWEVPLMALISELYFKLNRLPRCSDEEVRDITRSKIEGFQKLGARIAEFGTRRRYSYEVQKLVVEALEAYGDGSYTGTSNVDLAMKGNYLPIGTHAHEWFMFHAADVGYKSANREALAAWVRVYRGDLGIALSDTFTTDVFFRCFDKKYAKLFDGVRHDSGDPLEFADKTIAHYSAKGIDPLTKTIIFSDALTPEKVERIARYCKGKIKASFGIGTNFTNDVGQTPLNMVIKMSEAKPANQEWSPTVKLSDVKGKYTGNDEEIKLAKGILKIQ